MKKYLLLFILLIFVSGIISQPTAAQQDTTITQASDTLPAITKEDLGVGEDTGWHNQIKIKFIEGNAFFMSFIALAFIIGLAFCLERIIYLNLSETNTHKLTKSVEDALDKGDINGALSICEKTKGPVSAIYFEGLSRIDEGIDVVEKSVISAGGVQTGWLEKGLSWITLFIAIAPSLGFLGTVIGMIQAFDRIQAAGEIDASIVAGGMKIALITTVGGLIVALILQVFYNYILSKIENLLNKMEDATLSLLDMVVKYKKRYK